MFPVLTVPSEITRGWDFVVRVSLLHSKGGGDPPSGGFMAHEGVKSKCSKRAFVLVSNDDAVELWKSRSS